MRTRPLGGAACLSIALFAVTALPVTAQTPSAPPAQGAPADPHAGHAQEKAAEKPKPDGRSDELPPFVPPLTDEDRRAAFPEVDGHAVHDRALTYFVLLDQLEWQGFAGSRINVDTTGWIGRDRDRLWFRAEGDGDEDRVGEAHAHVLYGRQFARWWDAVAGIRQDFRPGTAQTWAAIGVQGLAPYWFEIEATAYVGAAGRTQARLEVEYELLFTNQLIVQPLVELEVFGKSDPERGIGAGLSSTDAGIRVRYEFRREFAPYVGVTWHRKHGGTADFAAAAGEQAGATRLVTGLRLWF